MRNGFKRLGNHTEIKPYGLSTAAFWVYHEGVLMGWIKKRSSNRYYGYFLNDDPGRIGYSRIKPETGRDNAARALVQAALADSPMAAGGWEF